MREKRKQTTYRILVVTSKPGANERLMDAGTVEAYTPLTARRRAVTQLPAVQARARRNGAVTLYAVPALSMKPQVVRTETRVDVVGIGEEAGA